MESENRLTHDTTAPILKTVALYDLLYMKGVILILEDEKFGLSYLLESRIWMGGNGGGEVILYIGSRKHRISSCREEERTYWRSPTILTSVVWCFVVQFECSVRTISIRDCIKKQGRALKAYVYHRIHPDDFFRRHDDGGHQPQTEPWCATGKVACGRHHQSDDQG